MGVSSCEVTSTQLCRRPADNPGMTIKTTLAALLLSACTIPGLTTGSTTSSSTSPAPAPAPAVATPAAVATAPDAPSTAPPPPELTERDVDVIDDAAERLAQINAGKQPPA